MIILNKINGLKAGVGALVGAVLPARCAVSGEMVEAPGLVHPAVWSKIGFIVRPFCARCGVRFDVPVDDDDVCPACLVKSPHFDAARAAVAYDDTSRDLILAFKHGDATHLVTTLGPWVMRAAGEFQGAVDMVMPVPLHRWRLLARRYNQAGILARFIARGWRVPFVHDVLVRVKRTESQGHKTRAERLKNVAGAFRVLPARRADIKGRCILLVDDVYTTGATVNACARALKRAGASAVYVVTIARVMRDVTLD
jgi:ComF family protein